MAGFVCHLERDGGTGELRRLRLVGPDVDRTWTPPPSGVNVLGGAGGGGGSSVAGLRSAAAWVADELGKTRELEAVCVDVSGGVCGWLSAPSAEPSVLLAAIQQMQNTAAGAGVGLGESSGSGTGFGFLGDAPLGPGSDRCIEALAPIEAPSGGMLGRLKKPTGSGETPSGAAKRRLAVLSIPDAAVRVFLDELDRLRIEVHAVLSLWHSIAAAWDPGRPSRGGELGENGTNGHHARGTIAESAAPVTATVLIEPSGRVLWSWSRAGDLIAAGMLRVKVQSRVKGGAERAGAMGGDSRIFSMDAAKGSGDSVLGADPMSTAPMDGGVAPARRLADQAAVDALSEEPIAECSPGQVGRLVMDWLAWSAQLGIAPDRIVCLGVETATVSVTGEAGTLGGSLAAAWPGATVDVVAVMDPLGATLGRLRMLGGLGMPQSIGKSVGDEGAGKGRGTGAVAVNDSPQAGLVTLAHRAGRSDRTLYRWAALGIALLAGAVFFAAYRLDRATSGAAEELAQIKTDRVEILKSVDSIAPGISTRASTAMDELQGKLVQAREEKMKLRREPTILPELVRLMKAMEVVSEEPTEQFQKMQIQSIEMNSLLPSTLTVMLPVETQDDRDLTAFYYKKLIAIPGKMLWGSGDYTGPKVNGMRKYTFPGEWPVEPAPAAPAATPTTGGKP